MGGWRASQQRGQIGLGSQEVSSLVPRMGGGQYYYRIEEGTWPDWLWSVVSV